MNAVLWADSDLDEASDYGNKPLGAIICVRKENHAILDFDHKTNRFNIAYRLSLHSGLSYLCGSVCRWKKIVLRTVTEYRIVQFYKVFLPSFACVTQ